MWRLRASTLVRGSWDRPSVRLRERPCGERLTDPRLRRAKGQPHGSEWYFRAFGGSVVERRHLERSSSTRSTQASGHRNYSTCVNRASQLNTLLGANRRPYPPSAFPAELRWGGLPGCASHEAGRLWALGVEPGDGVVGRDGELHCECAGWFLVIGVSQCQQYRVPSLIPGPALAYGWLFAGRFQGSA